MGQGEWEDPVVVWFDRAYGWLMRRWASDPRCRAIGCGRPYPRGSEHAPFCSDECAARQQAEEAW